MGYFRTKLIYEDIDGSKWKLRFHLTYVTSLIPAGEITVPAGFITDLASIPRFFHRAFPKSGLHNYAAVVHDYLYSIQTVPKELADKVFYEGMLARGVPVWKAWTMYQAVKWGGDRAWNSHKK